MITETITKTRTLHQLIDEPLRKHSGIALKGVDPNFVTDRKGERRLAWILWDAGGVPVGLCDSYQGLLEGACGIVKNLLLGCLRGGAEVGKGRIRADQGGTSVGK